VVLENRGHVRAPQSIARIDRTARAACLWGIWRTITSPTIVRPSTVPPANVEYRPREASIDRVSTVEDLPVLLVLCRNQEPRGRCGRYFAGFSPRRLGKEVFDDPPTQLGGSRRHRPALPRVGAGGHRPGCSVFARGHPPSQGPPRKGRGRSPVRPPPIPSAAVVAKVPPASTAPPRNALYTGLSRGRYRSWLSPADPTLSTAGTDRRPEADETTPCAASSSRPRGVGGTAPGRRFSLSRTGPRGALRVCRAAESHALPLAVRGRTSYDRTESDLRQSRNSP
jgi:hypothetical protein